MNALNGCAKVSSSYGGSFAYSSSLQTPLGTSRL
jgi:hypothetical protein